MSYQLFATIYMRAGSLVSEAASALRKKSLEMRNILALLRLLLFVEQRGDVS